MLDEYIRILSSFGKRESDDNYTYFYHSWSVVLTTAAVANNSKVSRNTAKKRLDELERFGLVEKVYTKKNVTLWKLKVSDKYADFLTNAFAKLTGDKQDGKEVKHLWTRP